MAHQFKLHSTKQPVEDADETAGQRGAGSRWRAAEVSVDTFRSALVQLYTSIKDTTQDVAVATKMEEKVRQVDAMLGNYQIKHPTTWRTVICKFVRRVHGVCPSVYFVRNHTDDAEDDDRAFLEGASGYGNSLPHTEDDYGTPDSGVKLFRTNSDKVVRCSQDHDFEHRGPYLEMMTAWEYSAMVQLVERPEQISESNKHPLFFAPLANGENHVLAETHMQMLRTKCLVPILASKRSPPPFPGPQPVDTESDAFHKWLNKAGAAARYYGALFVPHCTKTGKAPCQGSDKEAAWNQFCTIMQSYHEATVETGKDYKILNARFATVYNIAHCQRSSNSANMMSRSHRSRFSDSLKHVKGRKKDAEEEASEASRAATGAYMDGLVASMEKGYDPALRRQENLLNALFDTTGVEADDGATDDLASVNKFLAHNSLSIKEADTNLQQWKKKDRDYAGLSPAAEAGPGSSNSRHTTATVEKALVKLLEYVVAENMQHTFQTADLEPSALVATAERLVRDVKSNEDGWSGAYQCWQDALVGQVKSMLLNQDHNRTEDLVHGFLEGLSSDQLKPYLDSVATVRGGGLLRLLIHAPPGCGKT